MKRSWLGLLTLGFILVAGQSTVCGIPWSKEPLQPIPPPMPTAVQTLPSPILRINQVRPVYSEVLQRGKLEYKQIVREGEGIGIDEFNLLGKAGWEMCGVRQGSEGKSHFYFKRELSSWVVREPQGLHDWGPYFSDSVKGAKAPGVGAGALPKKQPRVIEGIDYLMPINLPTR